MKLKQKLNQKGFTLIEIIVVIVILAILAALIIPRFLNQPERAVIAEAQQMLGAIRRAQIATIDNGGGVQAALGNGVATDWNAIGMQAPLAAGAKFNYACVVAVPAENSLCTASRINSAGATRDTASISIALNGSVFACGRGLVAGVVGAPGLAGTSYIPDPSGTVVLLAQTSTRGCIPN